MRNLLLLCLLLLSLNASAAYVANAQLGRVHVKSNGYAYIQVTSPPADTCDWNTEDFRFSYTTSAGQGLLSQLLSTKAANRPLYIWYTSSTTPGTNETNGCTEATMAIITGIGRD